jgi:hypothetical protein
MIFDNLSLARPASLHRLTATNPKTGRERSQNDDNSNVMKILPVTILRTIDLRGKKNSGRLFSRFCAEQSVFFSERPIANKFPIRESRQQPSSQVSVQRADANLGHLA